MNTAITEYKAERHEFGEESGPNPTPGIMFVFYENDKPTMLDFLCPCGCGNTCPTHVVTMSEKAYQSNKNRRWGFDPDTLTVHPSIRFLSGCKAHFNITNGKVIMHADSGK